MKRTLLSLTCWGMLCLLSACQREAPPPTDTAPADPSIFAIPAALQGRLHMAEAEMSEIAETLRVPARIEVDEQRVARIGAAVTGRITRLHAELGQTVRKGQTLATLHSTELSAAQLAHIKAMSQQALQQKAVDRAKLLFESDVISAAELQRREGELQQAQAEQQASHDQLRVLGMSEADIDRLDRTRKVHSLTSLIAPLDGAVIERKVTEGEVVQPADVLFVVADLSRIWLVAEIPEQQADLIQHGGEVEAEVPALDDRRISGKLVFVSDTVDPGTRTVKARMAVENPARELKPGMLASMLIRARGSMRAVIPAIAVVRENNRDHVFVLLDEQRVQLREVKLGAESAGRVPVLDGLKPGERIVTEGAFHLNNERRRQELEG